MKNKIKFVRTYTFYGDEMADIVYHSGRIYTIPVKEMPKTAAAFMAASVRIEEQYDRIFHRDETLYF